MRGRELRTSSEIPHSNNDWEQTRRKEAEQCKAFFKMIPDALIFTYAGRDRDLIKMNFRPNPSFQPPSREARVFHQMEGEMWVDEAQRRLVRIHGHLIADVKFAGGLLGYLEKGGYFNVEERELLPGQWDLALMEVNMKGNALFFKTIAVQEKEYRSDFRTVPDGLTLADGADMLTRANRCGCLSIALRAIRSRPPPTADYAKSRLSPY
jgi:hypothetical protein